jgi:hypothetical protein
MDHPSETVPLVELEAGAVKDIIPTTPANDSPPAIQLAAKSSETISSAAVNNPMASTDVIAPAKDASAGHGLLSESKENSTNKNSKLSPLPLPDFKASKK